MNKLTEMKAAYEILEDGVALIPDYTILAAIALKDFKYLISLLEEKDKALSFYADEDMYFRKPQHQLTFIEADFGKMARKALNTSTNNEGETL
ncbi:hypothetical protein [Paenibacillus jilunlii]|uniref:Uncharacterized protein n=1 Tax=Paenibacillus jilunlii TaxID=682956 RepID=A0A1H0A0V9_9BACL|nr:hypothetical protein [Paenibacillus jilunlii]KWX79941.1 hypothetical protein AML91_01870 [Paenibacillus jilunlii]SDN27359.1 hypothetical protein SAMN05216191_13431 [Paenibacillus jilunlii]